MLNGYEKKKNKKKILKANAHIIFYKAWCSLLASSLLPGCWPKETKKRTIQALTFELLIIRVIKFFLNKKKKKKNQEENSGGGQ